MFIKSIRFKNTLGFMLLFSLILSLFGYLLYINLEKKLYSDIDGFLHATAVSISDSINTLWEKENNADNNKENDFDDITINTTINTYFFKIIKSLIKNNNQEDPRLLDILVQIYDNKGKIILSSKENPLIMSLSEKCLFSVLDKDPYYENIIVANHSGKSMVLRFLTIPIIEKDKIIYIVRTAISLPTIRFTLTNLRLILFILLPFTVFLTGIVGLILTNSTLSPIDKMIKSIKQITAENLKMRISIPETDDELSNLAETFNNMLDRLDKTFTSQHQLIADISHEIKTPLAIIKGQNEVALKKNRSLKEYKEILCSNLEEINRIIRISENILVVSQFDSKAIILNFEKLNLNQIIISIINDLKLLMDKKNIKFKITAIDNIFIFGDINQLKSLFLNLIDNSIKYTNKSGEIKIKIYKENNFAKIVISDSGIGIHEDDLPFIFNRFYRAIKFQQEKGFGLGLSIAKSIVEMHQGKIEVSSKINKGTTFTIVIPIYLK